MQKNQIEAFFKKLIKECRKENVYSVIETSEKMGVDYDQVRAWARANKHAAQILKECRRICFEHCLDKNDPDGITKKISTTEVFNYMEENNDEFRENRKKQEAGYRQDRLRDEAERKGNEFPPEKIERVEMVEMTARKAKQVVPVSKNKVVSEPRPLQLQTTKDIESERINDWKEREKRTTPSFYLKQKVIEDETGKKDLSITWESTGKEPLTTEQCGSSLCAATGSANQDYAIKLLTQTAMGCFKLASEDLKVYTANTVNTAAGVLLSLAPKDEIEGMLCTRLLVLHDQYMQFMGRASATEQTNVGIDLNINRATKLMRLYNETLDALNKHRRKGEQKVTVQHVNVGDGGQAIVNGQINQGGGDDAKK